MKEYAILKQKSWQFRLLISLSTTSTREKNDIDNTLKQSTDVSERVFNSSFASCFFSYVNHNKIFRHYVKMIVIYLSFETVTSQSIRIDSEQTSCCSPCLCDITESENPGSYMLSWVFGRENLKLDDWNFFELKYLMFADVQILQGCVFN